MVVMKVGRTSRERSAGPPPGYTTVQPVHYIKADGKTSAGIHCACGKRHVRIWKK